jgi:hypothetical protein
MAATAYEWLIARKADPNVVGREIARLAKRNGGFCTSAAYVDAARPETSPLHDTLLWDDEQAAELYRRDQARHIIRDLRVVGGNPDTPAFVHIRVDDRIGYVPAEQVAKDPDFMAYALEDAISRLNAVRRRYAALEELQGLWAEIDELAAA